MSRSEMVDAIVADMENYLERDPQGFWDHVREMESDYLRKMNTEQLKGIYEEIV